MPLVPVRFYRVILVSSWAAVAYVVLVVVVGDATLVPSSDALVVLALSSVLFGLAHLYQGLTGIAGTTVLGAALGALYLVTGTIVPGMALHALVDLRGSWAVPRSAHPSSASNEPRPRQAS